MTIRNLTPHAVNVIGDNGTRTFQSEGNARATQFYLKAGNLDGVRIVETSYGAPIDLPEPEDGVWLIVSTITANSARASGRPTFDLLTAVP